MLNIINEDDLLKTHLHPGHFILNDYWSAFSSLRSFCKEINLAPVGPYTGLIKTQFLDYTQGHIKIFFTQCLFSNKLLSEALTAEVGQLVKLVSECVTLWSTL